MPNYYEILGVNADADADTIKRAYRSLASKNHPDKGGDTARFQEIQIAYDTLSDPERRSQYDHQLTNPFNGMKFHFNPGNFDHADPFEHFRSVFGFGAEQFGRQRAQPRRNRSLRISIEVGLDETLTDQSKFIQINGDKNIKIDIPKGVRSGQTFKYGGLGDRSNQNLPPGDLLVDVHVRPHPKFQVSNFDLITIVEIDCLDALTGCQTYITNLEGNQLQFNVSPGTTPGTKYKMKGQGLFVPNSSLRGDLIAVIQLTIKKLDSDQIKLVQQLKQQIHENRS
jgi:DnaJ-class molecular chaperone